MQNNLLGIVATLGAGAAMIASDSFARAATHDVPLGAAIAGRGIVAFLILAAAAKASGQLQWHPRMRSLPVLTRIMAEVGAGMFFIGSLQHIPIANAASVLQFIPLVTMLVASVLFAERGYAGTTVRDIAGYVPPYPTMSEIGKRAAVSYYAASTRNPWVRRLIGFLRKFG